MLGEKVRKCFRIVVLSLLVIILAVTCNLLGRACGRLIIPDVATTEMAALNAWLADGSHLDLPDGYAYSSSKYQYMILDDADLGTIISDARMYVEDYYGIASELNEIPVILSLNETAITPGSSYIAGRVLDDRDTEEADFIVLYLVDIMMREKYQKHEVFWVMVHEYVHCARHVLGECDDEEAEEEGETTLITARIVKDVIGDDSDIGWYVDRFNTRQYTEWAEEAALRQGVEVPWN